MDFHFMKKKADYYKKMTDYTDDYAAKISYDGFLKENYSTTSKLAVPDASKYYRIQALLTTFGQKNSPTSTRFCKGFKSEIPVRKDKRYYDEAEQGSYK